MEMVIDLAGKVPLDRAAYEREHARTYVRFLHLVRWFCFHALVDLIGIFCFLAGHAAFGFAFLFAGTAILIWGIVTTRSAAAQLGGNAASPAAATANQALLLRDASEHSVAA